ncbi:O-antigen ligase family protein [Candidatus Kaiserbacteria bacterium]|nr:O-antigen ligase family protein [Candidatus Kaiserbacteria bacterium]
MRDALKWIVIAGIFLLPFVPLLAPDPRFPVGWFVGQFFFPYITGKNFVFRIIVEVVFAAWVLLALYEKAYRPRFSWIFASLAAFVFVIFLADLLGETPAKSLWSNYERMEGWVTLIHLLLYFIVVGSVFNSEVWWNRFFNTSLAAASLVSAVGLLQIAGVLKIAQGGVRIEAGLGNAIYLAVYLLFHVFIALHLFARAKRNGLRVLYSTLALICMFLVVQTGTRGTILGLAAGLLAAGVYALVFSKGNTVVRRSGIVGVTAVLVLTGIFYMVRYTPFVEQSPILGRVASIFSLKDALSTRSTIWNLALEGVKERPLLGWGQSNFDYVFDAHYKPSLYAQEPWFDRVHNIALDWLIAGGMIGFAAYLWIWIAALYSLACKPNTSGGREYFSIAERSLFIGLFVGYGIHNIAVFDNLISYFLFATLLAFLHARLVREVPHTTVPKRSVDIRADVVERVALPLVTAALCLSLYFVNVPSMAAAKDILDAFEWMDIASKTNGGALVSYDALLAGGLGEFKSALARGSFANQEIREQLALVAERVYVDPRASVSIKLAFIGLAESELQRQVQEQPNQARMHAFLGAFYKIIGEKEKALEQFAVVERLSPNKQRTLFDIGSLHIDQGDYVRAKETFKKAFELAPEYGDARMYYIVAALYADDAALVSELSAPPYDALYRESDVILETHYVLKHYDIVLSLLDARIEKSPSDPQLRILKATVQRESGDTTGAIGTLRSAANDISGFRPQAEQLIREMSASPSRTKPRAGE